MAHVVAAIVRDYAYPTDIDRISRRIIPCEPTFIPSTYWKVISTQTVGQSDSLEGNPLVLRKGAVDECLAN